jgi:hypothetical protein
VLFPDGGLMLNGHVWEVEGRGWMTLEKRPVFVAVDQVFRESATLYADRACTERLGAARRGPKL